MSTIKKIILNHDAWRRCIERGKDASPGVQANNLCRLQILKTKVLPWIKKITKKSDYVFQQVRAPTYTANTVHCAGLVRRQQELLAPTVIRFKPSRPQFVDAH